MFLFTGLYDVLLLAGKQLVASHWLYYQNGIQMFNECNPSGDFTARPEYLGLLLALIMVGALVTVKRVVVGYHLGSRMYGTCPDTPSLY
jgi:hypothetical protein